MKRVLSLALGLMLLILCFSFAPAAVLAEEDVSIKLVANPTELAQAGTVNLTASVVNNGDDIQDAVLRVRNKVLFEFGNLKTGVAKEDTDPEFRVLEEDLGNNIEFTLTYTCNGVQSSTNATLFIDKKETKVDIATKSAVDKSSVDKDEEVTFSFVIENQGTEKIKNASLVAPPLRNGKVLENFDLDIGASKTVIYSVEVTDDITVEPKLTYTAKGERGTISLDPVSVHVNAIPEMNITLSVDKQEINAGDPVDCTINLKNTGRVDFENIKVYDYNGNRVNINQTYLNAGKSISFSNKLVVEKTNSIYYSLTADYEGGNVEVTSNKLDMTVNEPSPTPSNINLIVSAIADSSGYSQTGKVTFNITVKNSGSDTLGNVVVSEQTIGEIGKVTASGNSEQLLKYEYTPTSEEDKTFVFTAKGTDAQGVVYTATGETLLDPAAFGQEGGEGMGTLSTLIVIIIVIVAVIVAAIIALIIVKKKDKGRQGLGAASSNDGNRRQPSRTSEPMVQNVQEPKLRTDKNIKEKTPVTRTEKAPVRRSITPEPKPISKRQVPEKKKVDFDDRNNF